MPASFQIPLSQGELFERIESREIPRLNSAREALYQKYADKLAVNPLLNRQLVSFQANKEKPFYRWIKYKEAFSSDLVEYLLGLAKPDDSRQLAVLDPFAGAGTTLTVAARMGCNATGIEILPVGVAAIQARIRGHRVNQDRFQLWLGKLEANPLDNTTGQSFHFPHLRITRDAFPEETERAISAYMGFVNSIEDKDVQYLFRFACLSILEEISYTRKDGQYLRWDYRSRRALKSKFNKGVIEEFRQSIIHKLYTMLQDIRCREWEMPEGRIDIMEGSCLDKLPELASESFDTVITSPPYANRYDYTRTYALEIAFMGHNEEAVKDLRQALLSCTVENKSKRSHLARDYEKRKKVDFYRGAVGAFEDQRATQEVLKILQLAKEKGLLNNSNIPTLVENYLFEMNLVIWELSRILKPGGTVFMVNDNVQYHGEEVPVDLILSDFAASAGLSLEQTWVLPRGKGNSSQQMGKHRRTEIRKCIYWWSKPA